MVIILISDNVESLDRKISIIKEMGVKDFPKVPGYIHSNLNEKIKLRPYQEEAISRFLFWWDEKNRTSNKFLFNMATGSGKTVIMASLILDLFKKGYRDFIFCVHLSNIVRKTKNNFLHKQENKYLFGESITIDGMKVPIIEVENFDYSNPDAINIMFSTIHGIHRAIHNVKEDSISIQDFEDRKIVLLSDEAHHLNASTKQSLDRVSWENTMEVLYETNKENVMLEFTATADLKNPKIFKKYKDILLYDYELKQFTRDKYCKDIQTIEFDTGDLFMRSLQAIILSQYRLKLFQSQGVSIKPVVMFKSNFVNKPKNNGAHVVVSKDFQEIFHANLDNLNVEFVEKLKEKTNSVPLKSAFAFFEESNITLDNLVKELKMDFSREFCICVNTDSESEELQEEVNNLESNEYRAVFAVDKLNEGWDVLNLFDIVRLYNTTPGKTQKPGRTTMQEAQLIGRGARYCPFVFTDEQERFMRKYDSDIENKLRICETMYYHCQYNPKYIEELRFALRNTGILEEKSVTKTLKMKESFVSSNLYKNGLIYLNKRIRKKTVHSISNQIKDKLYKIKLDTYGTKEAYLIEAPNEKISGDISVHNKTIFAKLNQIDKNIIRTALDRIKFYRFDNLVKYFPGLLTVNEFIHSDMFLGDINIEITHKHSSIEDLDNSELLVVCISVLNEISEKIQAGHSFFEGSREFYPNHIKDTFPKEKVIQFHIVSEFGHGVEQSSTAMRSDLYLDIPSKSWYAYNEDYGTDQEKYLVRFINDNIEKLSQNFDEITLIRNERFFGIYSFNDGARTEPDYLLLLGQKGEKSSSTYQFFIEPKGAHLMEKDAWKENFLQNIESNHAPIITIDSREFKIIGLPFFNEQITKLDFLNSIEKYLQ